MKEIPNTNKFNFGILFTIHSVDSVKVELGVPAGVELLMGEAAQDIGHLAGRDERTATWSPWMREWTATTRKVEWLVRAVPGTQFTITAQAQRAGTHRETIMV